MAALDAAKQILERLNPVRAAMEAERGGGTVGLAELATRAHFSRVDLSAHGFYKPSDDRCGTSVIKTYRTGSRPL